MSLYPSEQYEPFLKFAIELGKQASKMIQEGQAKRLWASSPVNGLNGHATNGAAVAQKKNNIDLVTETDQAVENFIKHEIAVAYPDHKFIGEETYDIDGKLDLTDDLTWIIDPIDGTVNFVHTHPFVGCSIGLAHRRTPVVGVCVLPFISFPTIAPAPWGTLYAARIGGGTRINETVQLPLGGHARPLESLQQCAVLTGWGSERDSAIIGPRLRTYEKLVTDDSEGGVMIHSARVSASSVVAMMQVATGQMDIYWDSGPWPWDVCAGAVIVKEAGGLFLGGVRSFERGTDHVGDIIMSRRYCVIRAVAPTRTETSEEVQRRIVGALYAVIEQPSNPLWGSSEHDSAATDLLSRE